MTAGCVCAAYVCVGVLTRLISALSSSCFSSSLDPRQTEGAPLHRGTSPPSLPTVLMVGLWGTGYKGGKEAKMGRRKALICFILQSRTESGNFGGQVLK